MVIKLTEHAKERGVGRGASLEEIEKVLEDGAEVQVKGGRKAKELVFNYNKEWLGNIYPQKKVKVIYVEENNEFVIITLKVYYGYWR